MAWDDWMSGPEFDAETAESDAEKQERERLERAEQDRVIFESQMNVHGNGSTLGSYGWSGADGVKPYESSEMRWDQTAAERIDDQIENFTYAGYAGGAADAIAAARGNMAPYVDALSGYGDKFIGESEQGSLGFGLGMGGLYDTAGTLIDYAQQGPGPSVAAAQHQANTAQAMRQQLALAGSGRGPGGNASSYRNAAAQQALIQGQANAQTAALQAQEAQDWRNTQLQAYGQAGSLYGQGAGIGSGYAQGMGDLAAQAQQGAGTLQADTEQLANQINVAALQGSMGYESNLKDIFGIEKGVAAGPKDPGFWDYAMYGAGKVIDYAL